MTQEARPLSDVARLYLRDLEVHVRNERTVRDDDRYQAPRQWTRRKQASKRTRRSNMLSTIIGETEMQYRHFDSPARAQVPSVEFRREIVRDLYNDRMPDSMDEGYWPSTNPSHPGWIGSDDEAECERQMEVATRRFKAFKAGEWFYVSVHAYAVIYVPIGGKSFALYTMQSPGLWGIESDAGDEYLNEIYAEECAALRGAMKHFGEIAEA